VAELIARAMKFADELIAHAAAQRTRLGKGEVVRIGWHAPGNRAS